MNFAACRLPSSIYIDGVTLVYIYIAHTLVHTLFHVEACFSEPPTPEMLDRILFLGLLFTALASICTILSNDNEKELGGQFTLQTTMH